MKITIALTSMILVLASCGGENASTANTAASASATAEPMMASATALVTPQTEADFVVEAPKDGATICGPVTLAVTAPGLGGLQLLPEHGAATLGRFVQDRNTNKWVLTFDPDTVAKDSVLMVRIAGSASAQGHSGDEVEIMRRHWLNVEDCPADQQAAVS
jgi:hypothetical protein